MIQQIEGTPENLALLKQLVLGKNEGAMVVKFVLLKQETLVAGEAQGKTDSAPSVILLGDLDEMKAMLSSWLDAAVESYKKQGEKY